MVIHNKYKPICPTGDRQTEATIRLETSLNLCSHTVSEPETFHLQVILRGKGSFMKQVTHTFEQDVRRSLYELSEIIEHKSRKFLYDSNIHIGTLANKKKKPHISLY